MKRYKNQLFQNHHKRQSAKVKANNKQGDNEVPDNG